MHNPEEYIEPAGFTEEDRRLAPFSNFHAPGDRKIVVMSVEVTVSVPVSFSEQQNATLVALAYENDPYVRSVIVM